MVFFLGEAVRVALISGDDGRELVPSQEAFLAAGRVHQQIDSAAV